MGIILIIMIIIIFEIKVHQALIKTPNKIITLSLTLIITLHVLLFEYLLVIKQKIDFNLVLELDIL